MALSKELSINASAFINQLESAEISADDEHFPCVTSIMVNKEVVFGVHCYRKNANEHPSLLLPLFIRILGKQFSVNLPIPAVDYIFEYLSGEETRVLEDERVIYHKTHFTYSLRPDKQNQQLPKTIHHIFSYKKPQDSAHKLTFTIQNDHKEAVARALEFLLLFIEAIAEYNEAGKIEDFFLQTIAVWLEVNHYELHDFKPLLKKNFHECRKRISFFYSSLTGDDLLIDKLSDSLQTMRWKTVVLDIGQVAAAYDLFLAEKSPFLYMEKEKKSKYNFTRRLRMKRKNDPDQETKH